MGDIQQSLPWLQSSWLQLKHYIEHKRIPQALLIVGKQGVGKQQLTEYFSKSLLCHQPLSNGSYCGECQSCLLINAKTHPDYFSIKPDEVGKSIGIAVIRQLTVMLALKPQYDGYRVVVINPADSLNNASANAFLKYLEEPTERTCIILVTNKLSKLPATIRSRCQKLIIPAVLDRSELKMWWEQQNITGNVDLLLNLSCGAPLLAQQFSEDDLLESRNKYFNDWLKLSKTEGSFIAIAEQWSKLDSTKMRLLVEWVISWVADVIKLSFSNQEVNVQNIDLATDLKEIAVKLDLKQVYQYYDFLLLSQRQLDTQLNKQLIFEEILIQWLNLTADKTNGNFRTR